MGLRIYLLSLIICFILEGVQLQNWSHYIVLDDDGRFHLHWKPPEDKRGDSEIAFKVEIEANGYFGLGISPDGGMAGSDIVTGWIKDGEVFFQDRHAVGFNLPHVDSHQDYELMDAYENGTFTVFEFRRKLNTCDENDIEIDQSTMRVIYAYSLKDPDSEDPFYHGSYRGVKIMLLLESKYYETVDLDLVSLLHWDVLSPGIDFSGFDTLYWCKIFQTPNVSKKNHIVYVKPMIEKGHENFIHHIGFYECVGGTPEEFEYLVDYRGHQCWLPTMPPEMERCQGFAFTWGIGGEAENGVKFFAVYPHAHLITRKIKVRHFRGNIELTPLTNDKNFDFKLQDFRMLMEEVDILPGDQITVECTYNSSQRSNVTFGGESSRSEMCMALVLYYPFVSQYLSFSAPSIANINKILNTNITSEEDIEHVLEGYNWTNVDIDEVEKAMMYSAHETSCHFLGFPKDGVNPTVSYPSDLIPLVLESTCNHTT